MESWHATTLTTAIVGMKSLMERQRSLQCQKTTSENLPYRIARAARNKKKGNQPTVTVESNGEAAKAKINIAGTWMREW